MKQSFVEPFVTTNRDYGSFYFGRLQHGQTNPDEIAYELAINDQVRNERRQLPSIAYDIMFDKHNSFEIVHRQKKKSQPVTSRRQMKYMNSTVKSHDERESIIKDALESYTTVIKCIYANRQEKNPQLSNSVLELIANELFLLNPSISTDELSENMVAVTVPHDYLGMSAINPTKPYPGTVNECIKTPHLNRLLDHFETVKVHEMFFKIII
ncbi:hypothetical protein I4U23_018359 [Adineta vaga]|nr:hypothetical protein I4U23_018359 [Adineta vaga]